MAFIQFTRSELYALVWAEPMRTLAERHGVSDVGLAKACRRHDIPIPERGYWAKLQHGKLVSQPPLPSKSKAGDRITLHLPTPRPPLSPQAQAVAEKIDAVEAPPPDPLRRHRIVVGWVKENAERRRQYRRDGWGLSTTPNHAYARYERRLKLYSALFSGLAARKFELVAGHGLDDWTIAKKEGEAIEFRIYERQRQFRRPLTAEEKASSWNKGKKDIQDRELAGDLVFKIKTYVRGAVRDDFRDQKAPLEDQLGEILKTFDVAVAELKVVRREREEASERYRREEIRRWKLQQRRELEDKRLERLLAEAAQWRKAQDLRAMIVACESSGLATDQRFDAWRGWALEQADRLDPVGGRRVELSLLPPFEEGEGGAV